MRLPSFRRPSPSMAVSIMALVVASTGTSYAAGLIGSDDVRNGSLKSRDFKAGQLPAGAVGPTGPAGVGRWALVDATGDSSDRG